jgi:hypothetical protein
MADDSGDGPACRKCGARPAGRAWLFVLGITLATLGFAPFDPGPLCDACRDRYNFLGVLMVAVVLVVAFVLVVVLLG